MRLVVGVWGVKGLIGRTGVYILQKYKFYSPVPQEKVRIFFPTFFLKSTKKGPEKSTK